MSNPFFKSDKSTQWKIFVFVSLHSEQILLICIYMSRRKVSHSAHTHGVHSAQNTCTCKIAAAFCVIIFCAHVCVCVRVMWFFSEMHHTSIIINGLNHSIVLFIHFVCFALRVRCCCCFFFCHNVDWNLFVYSEGKTAISAHIFFVL